MILDPGIAEAVKTFGTFGVVIWMLWFVMKTMLPRLIDNIQRDNAEIRKDFKDELLALRVASTAEAQAMRDSFAKEAQAQREAFASEMMKLRTDFTIQIGRLSDAISNQNLVLISIVGKDGLSQMLKDVKDLGGGH